MTTDSFAVLPTTVQALLEKRASHTKAIEVIDATLARVSSALGETRTKAAPVKSSPKAAKSGLTAAEFVLGLVKTRQNPTSKEINVAWKSAGRKWTADITLSQLSKAKKLVRTPLGAGVRGSRYSIPK